MKTYKNILTVVVMVVVCVVMLGVCGCSGGAQSSLKEGGLFKWDEKGPKIGYIEQVDTGIALSKDAQVVNNGMQLVNDRAKDKQITGLEEQKADAKTKVAMYSIKKGISVSESVSALGF